MTDNDFDTVRQWLVNDSHASAALDRIQAENELLREDAERELEVAQAHEVEIRHLRGALKALSMETFATPYPDGAWGLPPNTWQVPQFVRTIARHALGEQT